MIAMISGELLEKSENEAVILTPGGIGFRVQCSINTLAQLPAAGESCRLYTYMAVRDDAMDLYGFVQKEEKAMFSRLIMVSGVGPKSALAMLGSMPLSDLRLALLTGDTALLSRAPGIGKKTAQRLILELKDKLTSDTLSGADSEAALLVASDTAAPAQDAVTEALLALKALGYSPQESTAALKGVKGQADTADELIRLALRHMAQNS